MFSDMIEMRIASHLTQAADLILEHISNSNANSEEMMRRRKVVQGMHSLITNCLGFQTFSDEALTDNLPMLNLPVDTAPSFILLEEIRNRDVNISFYLSPEDCLPWYLNLCESLSKHSMSIRKCDDSLEDLASAANITIERISYIPAEARLEAIVDNITVNISPNDFFVLGFSTIIKEFDVSISSSNLFQRSLLLIKAWCLFEAQSVTRVQRVTGVSPANLAALTMINKEKVVEVLVLWLFASKVLDGATLFQILEDESSIDFRRVAQPVGVVDCEKIEDPFLVLIYFLHLFSRFEWSKWAVCSTGLIPLHPEMSEEIKGSQKVTGRLGDCDSALTSIVYDCRKSLGLDIDQHSDSTIVATSSIDSCSNFAGHQSVEGDHSGFDSLPSDHRNGEVCVLHPLKKGFNLCRKKRATIRASKSGKDGNVTPPIEEFVQISAIQEIFATGFKQITSTIRALTRQETGPGCASASDVRGRASMMPMKIVEHCFPQLFKSSKGSINHSSSCVESTQLDSGRDLLQISNLVPTNRADIYSSTDCVSSSSSGKKDRGRDGEANFILASVSQDTFIQRDPIIRVAASMSQGSIGPKGETDNRNPPTTKAATLLGSTPEVMMADTVTSEGRLGVNRTASADASSVFQIRQSPSQTPGTVGSNPRTEAVLVQRGASPTYVPKAGSFSTKIPTHVIQPFVKKEEHVWVPGKFSTSPDGFSGSSSSNLETHASSAFNGGDASFSTNARDQRGKTQSNILAMGRARLNGMSPDMSTVGVSGSSPTMGSRSGKNGGSPPVGRTGTNGGSPLISRRESPVLNGQGPLGPGIFTNKMAGANMRGAEGRSGNNSPYVSGHNSPFISGSTTMAAQSRSYDSNESILDERHRANQLALASHHQLLTRQRSAASLQLHSRTPSGQQQTGQRSPPIPILLQQRLSQLSQNALQPTSHVPISRHHSAPSSPQLFPPHTQLPISQLNIGSSQYVQPPLVPPYPPSQTQSLSSNQSSGFDLEFNGLRNPSKPPGFEAQLPSFLRDL